ncbi:MAG TPA: hypothetical protein IAB23_05010 [Candidatus Scybalocola faecavium]|nr:hypothetical protein [Candidatus Scybalocola faecavium]
MIFLKAVSKVQVRTKEINPALQSLFENCNQTIFLDANFFIVPDRSRIGAKAIAFDRYKEYWLDPLFDAFSNLSVHESVYKELVDGKIKDFVDHKIRGIPKQLQIHTDRELTERERCLLEFQISRMAPYSGYIPERDNAKDRGEIRSLAYMAVKKYLYFAANDNLPMHLICHAKELETGLDDMKLLQSYEVIYYLYKMEKYDTKGLRMLYKYQYYLTGQEKRKNPDWGVFIVEMDQTYFSTNKTKILK